MVQIRKRTRRRDAACFRATCWLATTAVIPLLFLFREQTYKDVLLAKTTTTHYATSATDQLSYIVNNLELLQKQTRNNNSIVELAHCTTASPALLKDFVTWATPVLENALTSIYKDHGDVISYNTEIQKIVAREFALELLEIYLTTFTDLCNWNLYKPTITVPDDEANQLIPLLKQSKTEESLRLVIVIIAHRDVEHLRRLVNALKAPTHYIVIHLDSAVSFEVAESVRKMCSDSERVFLLQFGSIVYKTDSVSMIHWQIMNWLHKNSDGLPLYDYYITLDGASYPLYPAHQLNKRLQDGKQQVHLGELWHKGVPARGYPQDVLWRQKRLSVTIQDGTNYNKWLVRLPRSLIDKSISVLPDDFATNHLQFKSNSGNQGIYHYSVIQSMLNDPVIRQLWATAKYGCCCCMEERSWVAALSHLGYLEQAMANPNMLQVWGGESTDCTGTMQNAVLVASNDTIGAGNDLCYRLEQPAIIKSYKAKSDLEKSDTPFYILGHELWDIIKLAKQSSGYMFARKFTSEIDGSKAILDQIEQEIWPTIPNQ